MELKTKILAGYLIIFVFIFAISPFIEDVSGYLMFFIPLLAFFAILIGVYFYLEKKKKDKKNN